MTHLQVKIKKKQTKYSHDKRIEIYCERIKRQFIVTRNKRRRQNEKTSTQRKRDWCIKQISQIFSCDMTKNDSTDKNLNKLFKKRWKTLWNDFQKKYSRHFCVVLRVDFSFKCLCIHKNLFKFENVLIVQMRSKRIELIDYFFMRRVFIFASPTCVCEWTKQTFKHVLFNCSRFSIDKNVMCNDDETTNFHQFLSTEKGLRAIAKWFMKINLLIQFSLIVECLF